MPRTNLALLASLMLAACHDDPGPCRPGDAMFSRLTGQVSVQGSLDQAFDMGDITAPCTVTSRPTGDRDADLETRTTIDLACDNQEQRLNLTFEVDDARHLDAGVHALETDDAGLRISWRPSASAVECYTYLPGTAYQIDVEEAVGTAAPYPALVSAGFHRKFTVSLPLALHGRAADQYTNGVVEPCSLDFDGTFEFSVGLDAEDYQARGTDTCVLL